RFPCDSLGPMPTPVARLATLALNPASATSLQRQLYDALREAILEQRLRPGARLPATRAFAADLGVGRNTVIAAFDQLAAEGYLEAHVGRGTRVAALAPDVLLRARHVKHSAETPAAQREAPGLSRRGELLVQVRRPRAPARLAFQPGLPAFDAFPFE